MFHVIIVDDESTIRNGIAAYVKSTYPSLSVDAVFEDGSDAIAYLTDHHADIVITDVRMSVKSGIDVAAYVFTHAPQTKVLFLSAYREFEYARQAMKYNVQYYIAKPVKLQELNDALTDVIAHLELEKEKNNTLAEEKEQLSYLLQTVKHDLYADILLGVLNTKEEITLRAEKYAIPRSFLEHTQCAVASIQITNRDAWHYGHDELYVYLLNLLRDVTGISAAIPLTQENFKIVFIGEFNGFDSAEDLKRSLTKDLSYLCQTTQQMLSMACQYSVTFCGQSVFDLCGYRTPDFRESLDSSLLEEKCREFLGKVLSRDKRGAEDIADALLLYARSVSAGEAEHLLAQFFDKIISMLPAETVTADGLLSVPHQSAQPLDAWLKETITHIFNATSKAELAIEDRAIIRAKEYIAEHMANDIGLEDVARFVYLSPVYFSRFFKQHTGITMTEYLTQLRMNHAMELLKSHRYKIYEISTQCGYSSSKYFAKIFKQYTGRTPSEYSRSQA